MERMIDMTEGEAEYLKYRFKQYLGSVSRAIQNKRLEEQEMGMTIIKDYGMPHNCYDCDIHNYHECNLTSESIEEDYCWNGDSREKHCPLREVEAIPKADYEARLKADKVAMLTDLQLEIEELRLDRPLMSRGHECYGFEDKTPTDVKQECSDIIQQKIDSIKMN